MDVEIRWHEVTEKRAVIHVPDDAEHKEITDAAELAARQQGSQVRGGLLDVHWTAKDQRFGGRRF